MAVPRTHDPHRDGRPREHHAPHDGRAPGPSGRARGPVRAPVDPRTAPRTIPHDPLAHRHPVPAGRGPQRAHVADPDRLRPSATGPSRTVLVLADKPGMAPRAHQTRPPTASSTKRPIQGPGGTLTVHPRRLEAAPSTRPCACAAVRATTPNGPPRPTGRTPSPQGRAARGHGAPGTVRARRAGPARPARARRIVPVRGQGRARPRSRPTSDAWPSTPASAGRPHAGALKRLEHDGWISQTSHAQSREADTWKIGGTATKDDHFGHARSQMNMPPAQPAGPADPTHQPVAEHLLARRLHRTTRMAPRRQPIRHPPPPRIRHSRSSPHPPSGAGRAGAIARHPRTNPGQGTALRARTARLGLVAQRTRLDESPRGNPSPPRNHAPTGHAQGTVPRHAQNTKTSGRLETGRRQSTPMDRTTCTYPRR